MDYSKNRLNRTGFLSQIQLMDYSKTAEARKPRTDWIGPHGALVRAAEIAADFDPEVGPMTLRHLFYRLVGEQLIRNNNGQYQTLSEHLVDRRLEGRFPELVDETRGIDRPVSFSSPEEAQEAIWRAYRRDRTEGQSVSLYLVVEKEAVGAQVRAWFGDLGVRILALKGFCSVPPILQIQKETAEDERPAVLLYAGDWDPSGVKIQQDFLKPEKTGRCWDRVVKVALTREQVIEHALPVAMAKKGSHDLQEFAEAEGGEYQVELDALPAAVLKQLFQEAIDRFWDTSAYEAVLEREGQERRQLEP